MANMGDNDVLHQIRELKRLAWRQKRELDETLTRIEQLEQQQHVAHLSPEERRARMREWTRRLGGASAIAAAIAALRWLRNRPGQTATVAAMAAMGAALVILPPHIDEPETIPETRHPLPWEMMPAVDGRVYPDAAVTATIQAPEQVPEPKPALADPGGAPPDNSDVAPEPEPQPGLLGTPEPEPETTAPRPRESDPTPTPEPEPTELADDEDEDKARDICLGLDDRPVTDLGLCIRKLLGLLEP